MAGLSEYDKEWCLKIHTELVKWPITSPFRAPVDPVRDSAPNYFQIIASPMDLTTMKRKLTDGAYKTAKEFVDDFHLVCNNAIKFNGENSMLAFIAADLRTWIDEQYKIKPSSSEDEWHKKLTDVVERLREHVLNAPAALRGLGAATLTGAAEAEQMSPGS
jgi:bromodomain-containing factor 1